MKPAAFFLDNNAARSAQRSLEAEGIPSTIVSTPLKENDAEGGMGYRLLVEETLFDAAEIILGNKQQEFMRRVQGLVKEREEKAAVRSMIETQNKILENRVWYAISAAVGLAIVAASLLRSGD